MTRSRLPTASPGGAGQSVEPRTAAAQARSLVEAGRVEEAEAVLRELTRSHPRLPTGPAGLARIAMHCGAWAEALRRWDVVLADFAEKPDPAWRAARARALIELGRLDEASLVFEQLTQELPNGPAGFIGLAQLATRKGSWREALDRWDDLLARFAVAAGRPYWETTRATVLAQLGQVDAAEVTLRAFGRRHPGLLSPLRNLLQLLVRTGRHAQALELLDASEFRDARTPAMLELRGSILIGLGRLAEARTLFTRALNEARDVIALERLFTVLPRLYEGWPRTERWLALRTKLDALRCPVAAAAAAPIEMLRARLCLALRDYAGFLAAADRAQPYSWGPDGAILRAVVAAIREPAPGWQKAKVFGVGLSRTGTTSLAAALTALGWPTLDWRNPLTLELMCEDDLHLFAAFTDEPVCVSFEKYYYQFPDSKFIYTTRPLEAWVASIDRRCQSQFALSGFAAVKEALGQADRLHYGTAFRELNRALFSSHADFAEAYRAHDRRVRHFFADKPLTRFLEFDIFGGDGWMELCAFLGCEVPAIPFPWENRASTIKADRS